MQKTWLCKYYHRDSRQSDLMSVFIDADTQEEAIEKFAKGFPDANLKTLDIIAYVRKKA
jgi:hypothetical protein